MSPRLAVVGAGWSGLAAALEGVGLGARVTLYEMAPAAGGRARDLTAGSGDGLDNGQHIAIGAYSETLRLMAAVGVAESDAFLRLPLRLLDPRGMGLRLRPGRAQPAFALAVLGRRGWSWAERIALLRVAAGWARAGFVCRPATTVAELAAGLPEAVRRELIEPLCVAALNTPAEAASGSVFLRVLRDALAAGRGASDLLLPRHGLSALLPAPALARLEAAGARIRLACRVGSIERAGTRGRGSPGDAGAIDTIGWRVDGEPFDAVVIAASAVEASRLVAPHDAAWAARAAALRHEPIVTVYAQCPGTRLPEPMLVLRADDSRPAQFVFDRGRLGGPAGLLAFVASGAADWVARGPAATEAATLAQAHDELAPHLAGPIEVVRTVVEKRATFRCTPGLDRPPSAVAPGLAVAGDYVEGPYPATLEGAVRSGTAAARSVLSP